MADKVTIQDIADALGLSRNTVSKAINNTGVLAEATRDRIIQKSIEMGYKQFAYVNSVSDALTSGPNITDMGDIALMTGAFLSNSHFASTMMDKFQREISVKGYTLTMHQVLKWDIQNKTLPISFRPERTKAILCVEVFDFEYCKMLCNLDIPVLFADGPAQLLGESLPADVILMNNSTGIFSVIRQMASQGITKIGFVGIADRCLSFKERYMAFRNAMYLNGLQIDEKFCLTDFTAPDYTINGDYFDALAQCVNQMDEFPELFICANDFVAIDLLRELRRHGLDCPKDILLCGFDDSPESRVMSPSLTTCHIHSQILGYTGSKLLMERIQQPNLNYRTVYAETDVRFRDSTKIS